MIYCLVGASGSGKSSIAKRLGLYELKSHTTRQPRPSDKGDEYYFVSSDEFEATPMFERVIYKDNSYGMSEQEIRGHIHEDTVVVVDRHGAKQFKDRFHAKVIYVSATAKQCTERMRARGDNEDSIAERIAHAYDKGEFTVPDIADCVVYNDVLDKAVAQIKEHMKPNLFIDVDNVVFRSVERFIEVYNWLYGTTHDWRKVYGWNFSPVLDVDNEVIEEIFENPRFYKSPLHLYDFCDRVIGELKKHYNIYFLTLGRAYNVKNKKKMLKELFPDINIIGISKNDTVMNKSIIHMGEHDIIIDDNMSVLMSSRAGVKICFTPEGTKEWNEGWEGMVAENWLDVLEMLR